MSAMRIRQQRLQRLRFRELDERAREALRGMLRGLPLVARAVELGGETAALDELSRLVVAAEPFASPLEHFLARLTGAGELEVSEARLAPARGEAGAIREAWSERPLARVRRAGPGFAIELSSRAG
jgi:hypothetical protein